MTGPLSDDSPSSIVQQMPEGGDEAAAKNPSLFLTPEQARLKLMTGEAMRSAKRLIDHFFRNEGERPRASIPAQPDYDDDLIVTDCLRYGAHICATEADLRAEVERQAYERGWRAAIEAAARKSEPNSYRAHHASVRRTVQGGILSLLNQCSADARAALSPETDGGQ